MLCSSNRRAMQRFNEAPISSTKLIYIDNLRIFIVSLVVVFHLALFYMPFKWYCCTELASPMTLVFFTAFTTVCQTFFMGLLFFISAHFTHQSFNKKNTASALNKRLIRLGIPIVVYLLFLAPFTYYLPLLFYPDTEIPYEPIFNLGSLWFIASLLIFTLIYVLFHFFKLFSFKRQNQTELPNTLTIMLFALLLGVLSFLVRGWFPVGDKLPIINAQLAHFPQYIAMFVLGIVAYKYQWLNSIHFKSSLMWLVFALAMIFLAIGILYYFGGQAATDGATHDDIPDLLGGWSVFSLIYSVWEQLTGVSLMIVVVSFFKDYLNQRTEFSQWLAENAYAVYILHLPMIVLLGLTMGLFDLPVFVKFMLLTIPSLVICFVTAHWIRKISIVRRVL